MTQDEACWFKTPDYKKEDAFSLEKSVEVLCPYSGSKRIEIAGKINLKEEFPEIPIHIATGILGLVEYDIVRFDELKLLITNYKKYFSTQTPNSPKDLFANLIVDPKDYEAYDEISLEKVLGLTLFACKGNFSPNLFREILIESGLISSEINSINYFEFFDIVDKFKVTEEDKANIILIFCEIQKYSKQTILNTAIAAYNTNEYADEDFNFREKSEKEVNLAIQTKYIDKPLSVWLKGMKSYLSQLKSFGDSFGRLEIDQLVDIIFKESFLNELVPGISFLNSSYAPDAKVPNAANRFFEHINNPQDYIRRLIPSDSIIDNSGIQSSRLQLYTPDGIAIGLNKLSECPFFQNGYFTQEI